MQTMLSVVVPCFNEQEVLPLFLPRLRAVLDGLGTPYEVICVDDGSRDGTCTVLAQAREQWPQLGVRVLTANVGHQNALAAGLAAAAGDHVVTMDADLQDPPELIPDMLRAAEERGVDVVQARRSDRREDSPFKRRSAAVYYALIRRLTGVPVETDVGDYRLLSHRVVQTLRLLPERDRVYRLLIPMLGFSTATVSHARPVRAAGTTKYPLVRMVRLAISSAISFSTTPLRAATALGLATASISLLATLLTVIDWVAGRTVPGWASLTCVLLFLGGVQLLCLGVLGEYIGRIYDEVKRRPLFLVDRDLRPATDEGLGSSAELPPTAVPSATAAEN
jgi:dolichol-phosphate mannosyltransferase